MVNIYKNLPHYQGIVIDGEQPSVANLHASLVNRSSKKEFSATIQSATDEQGNPCFTLSWSATQTALMPVGVYALQIYQSNNGNYSMIYEDRTYGNVVTSAETYKNVQ